MFRLLAFTLLALPSFAQTASVNLSWAASTTPAAQLSRYTIYRSTFSGQYAATNWIGNSGTAANLKYSDTVTLGAAPQTFYYTVRSQAADGKTESANSNEVKAVIPSLPVAPVAPKLICNIVITGAAVTGTCQ